MSEVPILTPSELRNELDGGAKLLLIDVRESDELEISALPGIIHIPVGEIEVRYNEIPKDQDVVIICRTGVRSGRTA
jgi:rhodanese-related sulfurtransferase